MNCHVVIHVRRSRISLVEHDVASWLWGRLRRAFPDALSAGLMPDHVHVFTPARDEDDARLRLSCVCNGLRRTRGRGALITWDPASAEEVSDDPQKVGRQVRYVALNPCREKLVADPLSWIWSTHRDLVGAVLDPWVPVERLARALRCRSRDFPQRHHQYVSADPSACVSGTAFPLAAAPSEFATVALGDVLAAALAATRSAPAALARPSEARRVALALAEALGWRDRALLARICDISPRTARWYAQLEPPDLRAALLCAGDARLIASYRAAVHGYLDARLPQSGKNREERAPVPLNLAAIGQERGAR
jgi:hypothetical protein